LESLRSSTALESNNPVLGSLLSSRESHHPKRKSRAMSLNQGVKELAVKQRASEEGGRVEGKE